VSDWGQATEDATLGPGEAVAGPTRDLEPDNVMIGA
jgi:hypothetical protein